jgi:hypothetical protein
MVASPARAQEGGLQLGGTKVGAKLRLEAGFNSNVLGNAEEASALQLNILPSVSLSTPRPGFVAWSGALGGGWRQYLASESAVSEQSDLDANVALAAKVNPNGMFSVTPGNRFRLLSPPNNSASVKEERDAAPLQNLTNEAYLELGYHPGGSVGRSRLGLSGTLRGSWKANRYGNADRDRDAVGASALVRYHFLPRTSAHVRGSFESVSFDKSSSETIVGVIQNRDSAPVRVFVGGETLFSARFEAAAEVGFGSAGFDDVSDSPETLVAAARATYYLSRRSSIGLEYDRDFADAAAATWLQYDTVGLKFAFKERLVEAKAGASVSMRSFGDVLPTSVTDSGVQLGEITDRSDRLLGLDAAVGFKISPFAFAGLQYRLQQKAGDAGSADSSTDVEVNAEDLAPNDFTRNQVFLTFELRY